MSRVAEGGDLEIRRQRDLPPVVELVRISYILEEGKMSRLTWNEDEIINRGARQVILCI